MIDGCFRRPTTTTNRNISNPNSCTFTRAKWRFCSGSRLNRNATDMLAAGDREGDDQKAYWSRRTTSLKLPDCTFASRLLCCRNATLPREADCRDVSRANTHARSASFCRRLMTLRFYLYVFLLLLLFFCLRILKSKKLEELANCWWCARADRDDDDETKRRQRKEQEQQQASRRRRRCR